MDCLLKKELTVLPSICDNTARFSVPAVFSTFMDLASEHGQIIGVGNDVLEEKGLFWLTVKTKIKINKRPSMMDKITASTGPEKPERIRCNRYYLLSNGEEHLIEGKSEWTIISPNNGKLHRIDEVYPTDIEHYEKRICEEPFSRLSDDFSNDEEICRYTVRSTDIDLGQHMNNAAYMRAIFGVFSCEELDKLNIKEAEILFKAPCFEGESLSVKIRRNEGYIDIGMLKEGGKAAAVARLTMGDTI